jgi:8-oxo-dGTP pyrophosphatase MutT (NUDIX family)
MTAAGVIPVIKGYILLGEDAKHYWSAFGGKQELNETLTETAYREFMEETCYLFPSLCYTEFVKRILCVTNTKTPSGKDFSQYVVSFEGIDCDCNLFKTFQSHLPRQICFLEKTKVEWFSLNNLPNMKTWFKRELLDILQAYYERIPVL